MNSLKNIEKEQLYKMIEEMKNKMQSNNIDKFKIKFSKDILELYRKRGWIEKINGVEYLFNLRVERNIGQTE